MYFRPPGLIAPKDLLNYMALKTFVLSVIVVGHALNHTDVFSKSSS